MVFRFRSFVVVALPLLLLGGLIVLSRPDKNPAGATAPSPAAGGWIPMDLSDAETTEKIPGWDVRRGTYRIGETDGKRVLELLPEPTIEGKVMWTRGMRGGGGVRARMRGEKSRRAFPRFSVGLHQERELHLRALPGERKLELASCNADLSNEVILASVPLPQWDWKPEEWTWLELQIKPQPDGTSNCEGRLWKEGGTRPDAPSIQHPLTLPPAVFFAALQGAPFSLRSIVIDAAATLPPGASSP